MTMPEDRPEATTAEPETGEVVYLDPAGSPAVRFLDELYAGCTEGWLTGITIDGNGTRVMWAEVGDTVGLVRQLTPSIGRAGVYFGVATRSEVLPAGRRGGEAECVELPGLWVDLDIAGPGHHSDKRLPTSYEQGYSLLGLSSTRSPHAFPLPPSIVVATGGGLHAYWLTVEAMDAPEGGKLNTRLHHHLSRLADQLGFEFDNTSDVPRILRLPGTKNVKPGMGPGGQDVRVVWPPEGEPVRRYQPSDLDDAIDALPDFSDTHDRSQTRRLTAVERDSEYFKGDSPFAIFNRKVTIPQMMDSLGMVKVDEYNNGNITWRRPGSENRHNFVYYFDDDHLACFTDQSVLTQHREYHPHNLLIDGHFGGNEQAATKWLIENGYVAEEVKAKRAAFELLVGRLITRQQNTAHAELVAAAVEAGEEPPAARLRGVDAFFRAQIARPDNDKPLAELERFDLPQLGFSSMLGHAIEIEKTPHRRWLIRDLIIEGQHGVLSAGAKTGKTTTVADLAVSVASGLPFLGIRTVVKTGPVLVFLGEGGVRPFMKRVQAIGRARGLTDEQIVMLPIFATERIPSIGDDLQLIAMAQAIADVEEIMSVPPALVVLDPWYLAAGADAELGNLYSMGALLDRVQRITAEFDRIALMIVHHHNRDRGRSGVDRMSGAGPMEWGRFLIALDADPDRDRTPEDGADLTGLTDVTIIVAASGGEIPAKKFAYRRKMATSNPVEAAMSPDAAVLTYATEQVPVDAEKDPYGTIEKPGKGKRGASGSGGGGVNSGPKLPRGAEAAQDPTTVLAAIHRIGERLKDHPEGLSARVLGMPLDQGGIGGERAVLKMALAVMGELQFARREPVKPRGERWHFARFVPTSTPLDAIKASMARQTVIGVDDTE